MATRAEAEVAVGAGDKVEAGAEFWDLAVTGSSLTVEASFPGIADELFLPRLIWEIMSAAMALTTSLSDRTNSPVSP